jgi:hypothetical protein
VSDPNRPKRPVTDCFDDRVPEPFPCPCQCGRIVVPTVTTPLIGYATMGCRQRIINQRSAKRARKRRAAAKAKALSAKEEK